MMNIGIFGTSGFAREVGDIAYLLDYEPVYIARDEIEANAWAFPGEVILEQDLQKLKGAMFAIGIGDNLIRRKVAERYSTMLSFANLIHPSATFGKGQLEAVSDRKGLIICAGVRFTNNIKVGDFSIFNLNATIGHDVICEHFVNIAPGSNISGNVHLESGCWIGTGAAINQGESEAKLRIGSNTTIGSGSVVVKHCEPNAVYVGIPAKRIK